MDVQSIALLGLQRADIHLEAVAARIAGSSASSSDGANLDRRLTVISALDTVSAALF